MNPLKGVKIFGVIGYPVKHSLSPAMHNAAFGYLGINAAYVAFEIGPQDLKKAIEGMRGLGICGINVTIPHKEAVIKYLDSLSREAQLMGAVNMVVNKNNRLMGHNTDAYGFMRAIKEDLKFDPKNKKIFILGAGGAAKAVTFGLALSGAKMLILTDKIDAKALELACELELKTGCKAVALKTNSPGIPEMILNSDLFVNATPCGMKPGDPVSVNPGFLHTNLRVFDVVYNRKTELIKIAKNKGLKAAGGINMLLYQGARAFELWTGKKAPVEVMRRALYRRLKV